MMTKPVVSSAIMSIEEGPSLEPVARLFAGLATKDVRDIIRRRVSATFKVRYPSLNACDGIGGGAVAEKALAGVKLVVRPWLIELPIGMKHGGAARRGR